ncbi:ATP-binding protein [Natrinema longum]|uniref:AAA family ATPase n=1 Tax=Natrinema longum TaxID=370324 RepID=A0A8A2U436_9EURY|nr:AAA family ATPase [Natrinema longum]MBZ6494910.1 AAA family ATPase [Natrinema longum]QSW83791.1 AAA family ATPase [Natrinema longum]
MSYANTRAHLIAELERIESLLRAYDTITETVPASDDPPAVGEVELAHEPARLSVGLPTDAAERLAERAAEIDRRCSETATENSFRLKILAERFDLSRPHLDVFLLAVAAEIDATYQTMFRELHDDSDITHPTVELIADLFSRTTDQQLAATALVAPSSPLRQHDLVTLSEPVGNSRSHQHRLVTVDPRLVSYLEGHVDLDPALERVADLPPPDRTLEDLQLEPPLHDRLERIESEPSGRYYFHGPDADERDAAIEALADDRLLRASLPAVLEADALEGFHREALLQDCPVHLTDADALAERGVEYSLEDVFDRFDDLQADLFVTGTEEWHPTGTTVGIDFIVEFPRPSIDARHAFWEERADELPADVDPAVLAGTFELTRSQLEAALATARSLADGEPTAGDVYEGCRAQSADGLDELAQRIEPAYDWTDIQLREKTERELRLIRDHVTGQARIYGEWGFAEGGSRTGGVVALFKGPSGTGKTMAAEVLANDVGMALYKIDLSTVVSKYIGETEENLERIFQAAAQSNAILLFDEADAVFGDRAEVADATDRYANAEVNYLLQRLERYDGVVVLTTNYASNIDDAFGRRIDHSVWFPNPEPPVREAIWRAAVPDDAPTGDLEYDLLAEVELTGGQISKIGRLAAIMADDRIGMEQIVHAIEDEVTSRLLYPIETSEYRHHLRSVDVEEESDDDEAFDEKAGERSPEAVVRLFFDLLADGDGDRAHELYHSRTLAEEFSPKEQLILSHGELSIVGEIDRVRDDHDRVVVELEQELNGERTAQSYELRPEEGAWRIFNVQRAREDIVVDR